MFMLIGLQFSIKLFLCVKLAGERSVNFIQQKLLILLIFRVHVFTKPLHFHYVPEVSILLWVFKIHIPVLKHLVCICTISCWQVICIWLSADMFAVKVACEQLNTNQNISKNVAQNTTIQLPVCLMMSHLEKWNVNTLTHWAKQCFALAEHAHLPSLPLPPPPKIQLWILYTEGTYLCCVAFHL